MFHLVQIIYLGYLGVNVYVFLLLAQQQLTHKTKQGFNIQARLQFDKTVEENEQNCNSGKPIIQYYQCSKRFTGLYESASSAFDKYARKHGATIIPSMQALVWPGLSLGMHMGRSVPAWSKANRPIASIFSRWIFDGEQRCQQGIPDNSICADMGGNVGISSVIPWLGGDYNPW